MADGKRVCVVHLQEAAAKAAAAGEEAARLIRLGREEFQRRQREVNATHIEMSPEKAFGALFIAERPSTQVCNSARRVLENLDADAFTLLALECLAGELEPATFQMYRGSTRGIIGRTRGYIGTSEVWWLSDTFGLTTRGRWIRYTTGASGGGGSQYEQGSKSYVALTSELLKSLLHGASGRPDAGHRW